MTHGLHEGSLKIVSVNLSAKKQVSEIEVGVRIEPYQVVCVVNRCLHRPEETLNPHADLNVGDILATFENHGYCVFHTHILGEQIEEHIVVSPERDVELVKDVLESTLHFFGVSLTGEHLKQSVFSRLHPAQF